jgi:hypothetical protein
MTQISDTQPTTYIKVCRQCGKPTGKRISQKFCNRACWDNWRRDHPRKVNPIAPVAIPTPQPLPPAPPDMILNEDDILNFSLRNAIDLRFENLRLKGIEKNFNAVLEAIQPHLPVRSVEKVVEVEKDRVMHSLYDKFRLYGTAIITPGNTRQFLTDDGLPISYSSKEFQLPPLEKKALNHSSKQPKPA